MPKTQIKIPLKPYLYKFLAMETNQPLSSVLVLDGNMPLGLFLYGLVSTANKPQQIDPPFLTVEIPNRDKHGTVMDLRCTFPALSKKNANRFNRLVDYLLCNRLFSKLELLDEQNDGKAEYGAKKAQILKFCDNYNTDKQELNYDMLRVRYQRWKKDPQTLIKSVF